MALIARLAATSRRARAISGVGVAIVVGTVAAYAGLARGGSLPPIEDELPAFEDPPEGPTAPSRRALGFVVGETSVEAAKRRASSIGAVCRDTSARALVAAARERKRVELAAAEAAGRPDTVSGASILRRRSRRERNPQVRLACDDVDGGAIAPRLGGTRGRLLLVFDSVHHPLRHLSFRRRHATADAALLDFRAVRESFASVLGRPGAGVAPSSVTVAKLVPYRVRWRFSDLEARVTLLDTSGRGIGVTEVVEVPWPVRVE